MQVLPGFMPRDHGSLFEDGPLVQHKACKGWAITAASIICYIVHNHHDIVYIIWYCKNIQSFINIVWDIVQ